MLTPQLETLRLFIHLLAAGIWVGGQIVIAGVVPGVRRTTPDALRSIAQGFARVAWPAFALAVLTGIWMISDMPVADSSTAYQVTFLVKIALVMLSAAAAVIHQVGSSKLALAAGGAIGLLAGLGAMFVGVLLVSGA